VHDFTRKLLTEWRSLEIPFEGVNVLVAVSGGADSCALALGLKDLNQRKKLNNKFIIGHFNHNVRKHKSDEDARFTNNFAAYLDFDFVEDKANPKQFSSEGNLEQFLRVTRYKFLLKTAMALKCHSVLVAHTLNDQAETFLLNLIRGSGVKGLSAMRPISIFESQAELSGEDRKTNDDSKVTAYKPLLIRPLLSWANREDTENFIKHNEVECRYDEMNDDLRFTRVRIRKQLIPELREYNPKIVETLARTSRLIGESSDLLNSSLFRKECPDKLKIDRLSSLGKPTLHQVLRQWLETHRNGLRRIGSAHIEAISRLIQSRKSGKMVELPGGESVVKQDGKLVFRKSEVEK